MARIGGGLLLIAILGNWAIATAEDLPAQGSDLQQKIEQVEQIDRQLAEHTQQLKGAANNAQERQRIRTRIQELQARQKKLLQEMERMVGPLPPSVGPEPTIPLEQQMESQRRRHETTLESDVSHRLKR